MPSSLPILRVVIWFTSASLVCGSFVFAEAPRTPTVESAIRPHEKPFSVRREARVSRRQEPAAATAPLVTSPSAPSGGATPAPVPSTPVPAPSVVPEQCVTNPCDDRCVTNCAPSCIDGGCCPTGWLLSVDALFLRRSSPDSLPLVTDQITGAEALNADALNFNHTAVPYFLLTRTRSSCCDPCRDCCLDWQVGYLGFQSWNDTQIANPPNSPMLLGPGFALPSSAPGNRFAFRNGTDLQTAEFNVRRQVTPCLTLLAGYRWLELSDALSVNEIGLGQSSIYAVDTNNRMHGFQLGGDAQVWNCGQRFHIDGLFRAAILFNNADQDTDAPVLGQFAPQFVDHVGARTDHTSFWGQLGLMGTYQLSSRFAVRGGYQLMWLEGVALAPDQIAVTNLLAPGTAAVDTSGGLFLHGASVGLQGRW